MYLTGGPRHRLVLTDTRRANLRSKKPCSTHGWRVSLPAPRVKGILATPTHTTHPHGLLMADAVTRAAGRAAKRSSRQAKHKATKRLHAEIFGSDSDDDGPPEYKSSDSWDEE